MSGLTIRPPWQDYNPQELSIVTIFEWITLKKYIDIKIGIKSLKYKHVEKTVGVI